MPWVESSPSIDANKYNARYVGMCVDVLIQSYVCQFSKGRTSDVRQTAGAYGYMHVRH